MLSQKELKKLLHYNPDTGVFTRLASNSNFVKVGDIAGCLSRGYIHIKVNGKKHFAHRLAWLYVTGTFPKDQIDHINHIKDDNRWVNLREVTQHENGKNLPKMKTNSSGVTGVYWRKDLERWEGKIKIIGKLKHLGSSTDKFEVICTRKSAENKYGFHENHGQ